MNTKLLLTWLYELKKKDQMRGFLSLFETIFEIEMAGMWAYVNLYEYYGGDWWSFDVLFVTDTYWGLCFWLSMSCNTFAD